MISRSIYLRYVHFSRSLLCSSARHSHWRLCYCYWNRVFHLSVAPMLKVPFTHFFSLISLLFFFQFCFVVSFVYEANLLKVTKTMNENHFVVSAMNMDVFFSSIVFISRLWFGCADDYRKNYYGNACNQGANSKKAKKMKFII